jgi:hypothetical protein
MAFHEQLALASVGIMGRRNEIGINNFLDALDATSRFNSTHCIAKLRIEEPVQRWHGRAVKEVGSILNNHGIATIATHNNAEGSFGFAPEQVTHDLDVGRRRRPDGHRFQNSRVLRIRCTSA